MPHSSLPRPPRSFLNVIHVIRWVLLKFKVRSFAVFRGKWMVNSIIGFCQDAFLPRVSTYSLSVAVVTSPDSSFHNLHHILLVSRRSKAAVNRQGWSFSRIHSTELPDCERTLLADNLVFWCSSPNSHSSSDPISTICSFSEVRCHRSHVFVHKLWYRITS